MAMRAKFKSIGKSVLGLNHSHTSSAVGISDGFRSKTLSEGGSNLQEQRDEPRASLEKSTCSEYSEASSRIDPHRHHANNNNSGSEKDGNNNKHKKNASNAKSAWTSLSRPKARSVPCAMTPFLVVHDTRQSNACETKIGALEVSFSFCFFTPWNVLLDQNIRTCMHTSMAVPLHSGTQPF